MSYHGYLSLVKQHLHSLDNDPALLEIGVDRGVSFVTLAMFLARTRERFFALGIDVLVQEQVVIMLNNLDLLSTQKAIVSQGNSLEVLPKLVQSNMKFDVLLLDGDHNYHTVSQEMSYIDSLVSPKGIVIVDDYSGRWSERDLFYSERDEYKDVIGTTARVNTDHHGVKPAVDQWLLSNQSWELSQPIVGEPVLLRRKG